MDDGVRFQPEFARSVANTTSHVTTLDFWSVDLNSYLFKEKKLLSQMAALLAYSDDAREWEQDAEALLPKLQNTFFVPDGDRAGFFSDVYFNGSALPIKGCEGFAALFFWSGHIFPGTEDGQYSLGFQSVLPEFQPSHSEQEQSFLQCPGVLEGPYMDRSNLVCVYWAEKLCSHQGQWFFSLCRACVRAEAENLPGLCIQRYDTFT